MQTIGVIGLGKMGEAIASALAKTNKYRVLASVSDNKKDAASKNARAKAIGISKLLDSPSLVNESDIIFICVKPHQLETALLGCKGNFSNKKITVSICAGVTLAKVESLVGKKTSLVRAMPNGPCVIGQGVTALCSPRGSKSLSSHDEIVEAMFQTMGLTVWVDEDQMNAVTGLSGSGPAYVYLIIEALSDGGVKMGLSREVATLLATQTLLGSAAMVLKSGLHPAHLKDAVMTPKGCTVDGLMALEEGRLRVTLMKAVVAATLTSEKLAP